MPRWFAGAAPKKRTARRSHNESSRCQRAIIIHWPPRNFIYLYADLHKTGTSVPPKRVQKKMRHHLFPFRQQHYVYQIWRGKNELYRAQKPFCHGPVEKGTISSHYLTIFTLHKATTHFKLRYPRALLWSHHLIFAEFTGHTTLERRYVLETNTAPWQIQTFDKHYWAQNCSLSSCHFLTVPSNSGNEERTSSSRSSNANCFKQTGDCMGKKQI